MQTKASVHFFRFGAFSSSGLLVVDRCSRGVREQSASTAAAHTHECMHASSPPPRHFWQETNTHTTAHAQTHCVFTLPPFPRPSFLSTLHRCAEGPCFLFLISFIKVMLQTLLFSVGFLLSVGSVKRKKFKITKAKQNKKKSTSPSKTDSSRTDSEQGVLGFIVGI